MDKNNKIFHIIIAAVLLLASMPLQGCGVNKTIAGDNIAFYEGGVPAAGVNGDAGTGVNGDRSEGISGNADAGVNGDKSENISGNADAGVNGSKSEDINGNANADANSGAASDTGGTLPNSPGKIGVSAGTTETDISIRTDETGISAGANDAGVSIRTDETGVPADTAATPPTVDSAAQNLTRTPDATDNKYTSNVKNNGSDNDSEQFGSYILNDLPDDLYSFAAELDGVIYSLPAPYGVFEINGWISKNTDLTKTVIGSDKTELVEMVNGGHSIYMGFVNNSGTIQALSGCDVGIMYVGEQQTGAGTDFKLPGGITIGTEYDEISRRYGTESSRADYSWAVTLIYKEQDSWLEIELEVGSLKITSINYRNFTREERLPGFSGTPPAILSEYETPEVLSSEWQSLVCLFGGDLYRLPAPALELLKNGWIFVSDENYMLGVNSPMCTAELRRDNQVLYTKLANFSDSAQPVKFCHILELSYDKHNTKTSLELPGGVSEISTVDEIFEIYGEPDRTDDGAAMFIYYSYVAAEGGIDITWSIESSKIVKLELRAYY